MKAFLFAALACLAGCSLAEPLANGSVPAPIVQTSDPGAYASELMTRSALASTLAYTAAARGAKIAIQTGLVKDQATIALIGRLDERAYGAIQTMGAAQKALNYVEFTAALDRARSATADLLRAYGDKS